MPNCTACGTPGAYIGFTSVECRNPSCAHFALIEDKPSEAQARALQQTGRVYQRGVILGMHVVKVGRQAGKTGFRDGELNVYCGRERNEIEKLPPLVERNYIVDGKIDMDRWRAYLAEACQRGAELIAQTVQENGPLRFYDASGLLNQHGLSINATNRILRHVIDKGPVIFDKGEFIRPTINFNTSRGNLTACMRVYGNLYGSYDVDVGEISSYEDMKTICGELYKLAADKKILIAARFKDIDAMEMGK